MVSGDQAKNNQSECRLRKQNSLFYMIAATDIYEKATQLSYVKRNKYVKTIIPYLYISYVLLAVLRREHRLYQILLGTLGA